MFSLITYGIAATALLSSFIYLDVYNKTVVCWKKFRKINRLVSTNYKGFCLIIWISCCMVSQALWISIIQYMNSTVVKLDGNKYRVTYRIKGNTYKMIVKLRRGPRNVLLVSDESQDDVSAVIFPYLGPGENFHGEIYTPRFFEREELVFELSNGNEKIFRSDDDIVLT